ncbi:hypothetical protein EMIHUDRAFT_195264 [Emiliania huxleyi CCMP1516]|uniref:Lon N-terminal domain-containing protein n=2 Tax=Emiliania huxleyi TaxID=2903 RepID=A0A0D3JH74_EMIH1|nr:hypothetical protein EMIHUDRAFT_195264 [Emiliania huxleyi CCMP1516]EOD22859.1 hypothetical protein EMIHUDRAFT_195264 [Emiliania huxleyi CCMP1516]|eukprot:XP_005775288.1 hypothetical protein EMIHUDRAFT_195264 [Emiliania huxleyi CCMP1516]
MWPPPNFLLVPSGFLGFRLLAGLARPPLLLLDEESGDINDGGISSVNWVTVDASGPDVEPTEEEGTSVMPLFPLGAAYLPHTTPVLNIFEPRYRAMYNDILFNGARRFMVTNVEPETGALAEVGVVFYLDELKEDRVKYIGQHRVINRSLSFARGTSPSDRGLWGTIGLWQQFLEQRTQVLGQKMQREIQSGVASYLSDNSLREDLDLPPELIAEIEAIQRRYRGEVDALDGEPGSLRFQAPSRRWLATRKSLQSLFSSGDAKGEGEGGAPDDKS